jgi:hypothetical protein
MYKGCDSCMYICMCMYIYTHTYTCTHAHTHTHTDTHTHTQALEDTGDVGAYNRANRSVNHMVENFGAIVAGLGLVGGELPSLNPKAYPRRRPLSPYILRSGWTQDTLLPCMRVQWMRPHTRAHVEWMRPQSVTRMHVCVSTCRCVCVNVRDLMTGFNQRGCFGVYSGVPVSDVGAHMPLLCRTHHAPGVSSVCMFVFRGALRVFCCVFFCV